MADLKSLLEAQLKAAHSLMSILEREKSAITQRVAKDIEQVANEKVQIIVQIQSTDNEIKQHPDVELLTSSSELAELTLSIQDKISDCQLANQANGEALERAQLSLNKLKNMMQQSQGKLGMTYGADGNTRNVTTLGTNLKA